MSYMFCQNCKKIMNIERNVCPDCGSFLVENIGINIGCLIILLLWISISIVGLVYLTYRMSL